MKPQIKSLTLLTNGNRETRPSLEYGIWLAEKLKFPVKLLAVQEPGDKDHPVAAIMSEISPVLQTSGIEFQVEYIKSPAEEVFSKRKLDVDTLVVLGPLGRPRLYDLFMGHSFRLFMEKLAVPFLYVPKVHLPVKKILVCMGGLGYAMDVFHTALSIARPLQASLTFLHVVEPVTLDYSLAREVEEHWQDLLSTDTPQGQILRKVMGETRPTNLRSEVKVRHGHIVPEILAEVTGGNYDLVCMGSMYSSQSLRHLTLPNITAEIAELGNRPILIVRAASGG